MFNVYDDDYTIRILQINEIYSNYELLCALRDTWYLGEIKTRKENVSIILKNI